MSFLFPHNEKPTDDTCDDGIVVVESNEGEIVLSPSTLTPIPKSGDILGSSIDDELFNGHATNHDPSTAEEFRRLNKREMNGDLPPDVIVPAASPLGFETGKCLDDLEDFLGLDDDDEPSPFAARRKVLRQLQAAIEETQQQCEKQMKAARLEKLESSYDLEGISLSTDDLNVLMNSLGTSDQETKHQQAQPDPSATPTHHHTLAPKLQDESAATEQEKTMDQSNGKVVLQETTAAMPSSASTDFPFETLASIGRRQMEEQAEEPTTQEEAPTTGERWSAMMIWSFVSAGVYRTLRGIVATTWWGAKSLYQTTTRGLLCKLLTSRCLVMFLAGVVTTLTFVLFDFQVTAQQVLLDIVPMKMLFKAEGDTLFVVTVESEPIIVSTEESEFVTMNDHELKSNESLISEQEDPSGTLEELPMLANFLAVMLIAVVVVLTRRPDGSESSTGSGQQSNEQGESTKTTNRPAKLENRSSSHTSNKMSKSAQESFEVMTTPQLRKACKKREISPKAIKKDTVRLLCTHDNISHSFPNLDLSNYKALSTKELQLELEKVKPGASMWGNKDDLRYRLVVAREERFMELTCPELRTILKQHYMIKTGLKKTLTRRLAEAGPSVQP